VKRIGTGLLIQVEPFPIRDTSQTGNGQRLMASRRPVIFLPMG